MNERRPDEGHSGRAPDETPTPLQALLHSLAKRVSVERIDQVWLFPPRQSSRSESALVVAAAFNGGDDRRRVLTARYVVRKQEKGASSIEESVVEHAVAPADRLPRVIDGVVRRLDDELADLTPRHESIGGDAGRWQELLEGVA